MMMPLKIIATGGGDSLQLMIGQRMPELPSCSPECIAEEIIGIVHLIDPEHRFQTSLIEACVMCDEGDGGNQVGPVVKRQLPGEKHIHDSLLHLMPDLWEDQRIVGVATTQSMHPLAEPTVIIRFWLDKAIERIYYFPIAHHDDPHRADARWLLVGRLKVNGNEIP